jgi:hypothetical protein
MRSGVLETSGALTESLREFDARLKRLELAS